MQPTLHNAYKRYAYGVTSFIMSKSKKTQQQNMILEVHAEPKKDANDSYSKKGILNKKLADSFDMNDGLGHMYGSW